MFLKNGEVHQSGIKNEHNVIYFLNTTTNAITTHLKKIHGEDIQVIHKGGTTGVDDATVMGPGDVKYAGISIKNHKSGTHDWTNTSKIPNKDVIKDLFKEYKDKYPNLDAAEFAEKEKPLREERDAIVNTYLRDLSGGYIKGMLTDLYEGYSDYVIMNDMKSEQYILYDKNMKNFKEFVGFPRWDYYLKFAKAQNSAMIWRKNQETNDDVCTNLRLRITLNNGLNAFFGLSANNKTSIPCLKLQQDAVDKHMASLDNPISVSYKKELDAGADAKADSKAEAKDEM
jgi:hypothetical protein